MKENKRREYTEREERNIERKKEERNDESERLREERRGGWPGCGRPGSNADSPGGGARLGRRKRG